MDKQISALKSHLLTSRPRLLLRVYILSTHLVKELCGNSLSFTRVCVAHFLHFFSNMRGVWESGKFHCVRHSLSRKQLEQTVWMPMSSICHL